MKHFALLLSFILCNFNIYSSQENMTKSLEKLKDILNDSETSVYELNTVRARSLVLSFDDKDFKEKILEKIASFEEATEKAINIGMIEMLKRMEGATDNEDPLEVLLQEYSRELLQKFDDDNISPRDPDFDSEFSRQDTLERIKEDLICSLECYVIPLDSSKDLPKKKYRF